MSVTRDETQQQRKLPETVKDATKLLKDAGFELVGTIKHRNWQVWENRTAGRRIEIPNTSGGGHLAPEVAKTVAHATA